MQWKKICEKTDFLEPGTKKLIFFAMLSKKLKYVFYVKEEFFIVNMFCATFFQKRNLQTLYADV